MAVWTVSMPVLKAQPMIFRSYRWKFIPTTNSNHGFAVCENILNRDFQADRAGEKWVSDITYLYTLAACRACGFLRHQ
jgi:transposase InsO family protein